MTITELHLRIKKIIKKLRIPLENTENHANPRISHWKIEIIEILEFNYKIMKFNWRIMKIMKIMKIYKESQK